MPAIIDGQVDFLRLKIEKTRSHVYYCGVDFHHINPSTAVCKIPPHYPNTQSYAKHVVNIRDVRAGQLSEQKSKRRSALFANWIVGVLIKIIIQVKATRPIPQFDNLQPAKMRVAAKLLKHFLIVAF